MLRKVRVEAFFCVDDALIHWTFECVIFERSYKFGTWGGFGLHGFFLRWNENLRFSRKLIHRLCMATFRRDRNSRLKQVLVVFGKRATFRLFTSLICKNITKLGIKKWRKTFQQTTSALQVGASRYEIIGGVQCHDSSRKISHISMTG